MMWTVFSKDLTIVFVDFNCCVFSKQLLSVCNCLNFYRKIIVLYMMGMHCIIVLILLVQASAVQYCKLRKGCSFLGSHSM